MILAEGWRISALSILDDTALTTEQDDEHGERYKKNKVVECRSTKENMHDSFSSPRMVSPAIGRFVSLLRATCCIEVRTRDGLW